jgi:hypothetical protein
MEVNWSASRHGRFTLGERALASHWLGGWVGPRAGVDSVEKVKFLTLPGLKLRPLGSPVRSQALYRLRYPEEPEDGGSSFFRNVCEFFYDTK